MKTAFVVSRAAPVAILIALLGFGWDMLSVLEAQSTVRYEVVNIGPGGEFPGFVNDMLQDMPIGINEKGEVVGMYFPQGTDGDSRAFYWSENGGFVDIAPPSDGRSAAYAINESGVVTGFADFDREIHAFRWTAEGGIVDLGTAPLRFSSQGFAINDAGSIVCEVDHHAWLLDDGWVDVGSLQGEFGESAPLAINNSGAVVGRSHSMEADQRPFLWTREDGISDLGSFGSESDNAGIAFDINERGVVVGYSSYDRNTPMPQHAFRWEDGVMTDLGSLGGSGRVSEAYGINNTGYVVGWSNNGPNDQRATLWTPDDEMVDLSSGLPDGWKVITALDINDAGSIIAFGTHEGRHRSVVLKPLP